MRDRDTVLEIREHRTNGRYTGPVALAPSIEPTNDLAAAVLGARLVLVVVPSAAARAVIRELGGAVLADQIVRHAIKGLEGGAGWARARGRRAGTALPEA